MTDFSEQSLRGFGFSWPAALSLALASQLTYRQDDTVKAIATDDWGMASCDPFSVDDTQGFIAESAGVLLVVFRGTESLGDWITNIGALRINRRYGAVHRGFFKAYEDVDDIVRPRILAAAQASKAIWLTGHSLGGALATLAGMEMPDGVQFAGLQTFGQPRMLKRKAQVSTETRFGSSYARFVNNDDIVPRIPPLFGHAGSLLHFDHTGNLMPPQIEGLESLPDAVGAPLTEAEFETLKDEIKAIQGASSAGGPELEGNFDVSVEGLIPGVDDHAMERYISAIRRQVIPTGAEVEVAFESVGGSRRARTAPRPMASGAPELEGMPGPEAFGGPVLESAPFERDEFLGEVDDVFLESVEAVVEAAPDVPALPYLVRLRGSAWSPPSGVKVNSQFSGFATVLATETQLEQLRVDPMVVSIEGSRDAGMMELDDSVPFVGGDDIHRPPVGEKGDAAFVGIVDTGVDILHKAFRDANGKTRIKAVWNQRDSSGPTPKAVDPTVFTQDYGTLVLADEIDQHIQDFEAGTGAPSILLRDPWQHGTHVASIAAGQATGNLASGMAPEAGIIAVMPNMQTTAGDPPSLGYSNSHIDALVFLKTAAAGGNRVADEGKPIAINVSLGMNAGAHDGSSALEAAFDGITGGGRDEGCVIVKSAGNERGHGGHAETTVFLGMTEVTWTAENLPRSQDYLEAWFAALDDVAFVLVDPSGNRSDEVSFDQPVISTVLGGNSVDLRLTENHRDNGDNRLVIMIRQQSQPIQPGQWALELIGRVIRSDEARVNIWVERHNSRALKFDDQEQDMTLSIPGTANTVITVGACNTSEPLRLNRSSSYGRTRDRRAKPEVCAPGHGIKAAHANRSDLSAVVSMPGTSMAAPHVAGALALVLSARAKEAGARQFNARQLQKAVLKTTRNFSHVHHPGFGYGVLDAKALFEDLIS
ncbi:MAG: S8 family serine peptidase [Pseudomonadota bacterium]